MSDIITLNSNIKKLYTELREHYIVELEFDINLLKQVEEMNNVSKIFRKRTFLDWSDDHSIQLRKMTAVHKYLIDNPVYWDYRVVEAFYNQIPEQNEESTTHTSRLVRR